MDERDKRVRRMLMDVVRAVILRAIMPSIARLIRRLKIDPVVQFGLGLTLIRPDAGIRFAFAAFSPRDPP